MKLVLAGLAFAGLVNADCGVHTCANTAGTEFATAIPFPAADCGTGKLPKTVLTGIDCTGTNDACTAGDCCAQTCAAGTGTCTDDPAHLDRADSTEIPCAADPCVAADFDLGGNCCPASVCAARTADEWVTAGGGIKVTTVTGTSAGAGAGGVGTVSCADGYGQVDAGPPEVVCDDNTWTTTNACAVCANDCVDCTTDGSGGCDGAEGVQGGCAAGYVITTASTGAGNGDGICSARQECSNADSLACGGTVGFTTAPTALCATDECDETVDFADGAVCCPAATCDAAAFTGEQYGANDCANQVDADDTCAVQCASGYTYAVADSAGTQTCTGIANGAEWRDPNGVTNDASTHLQCQACAANCNKCDDDGAGGCDAGECATGYHIEGTPSADGQATASCAVNECVRFTTTPPLNQKDGTDWAAGSDVTSNKFIHGQSVNQEQIRNQIGNLDWKCKADYKFDAAATFVCDTDGGAASFSSVCIQADCDAASAAAPGTPKYSFDCENDMGWYNTIGESCQIYDTDAGYAGAFVTCTDGGIYIYHDAEFVTCPDSDGDSAHTMPSQCQCNADYFKTEQENSVSKITPVGISAYTTGGCAPTCKFATTTGYAAGNCGTDAATADTACVPVCASGYNSVAAGAATGTCLATATANAGPGDYQLSGCVDTCPAPANPTGGTYSIAGTTLSFSADNGYTCTFTDVECNPDTGAWTDIVPASCTATAGYCAAIDGANTDVDPAIIGGTQSPQCAEGYAASPKTYTCTANGETAGVFAPTPAETDCEIQCLQPTWDALNIVAPATSLNILSELTNLQCADGYFPDQQLVAVACTQANEAFTITGACKAGVYFDFPPAPWFAGENYDVTVRLTEAPTADLSIGIDISQVSAGTCTATPTTVEITTGVTGSFVLDCTEVTGIQLTANPIGGTDADNFTQAVGVVTGALPANGQIFGKCTAPDWTDLHIDSNGIPASAITSEDVASLSCVTGYASVLPLAGACNNNGQDIDITGTCVALSCAQTPVAPGYIVGDNPVWDVDGFLVPVTCAAGFYESGTLAVTPCTTQGGAVGYSGCSAICEVPNPRTGFTDGVACGATLQQGASCSRVCADGYYSSSDTTSWTIECGCSANVVNWAGLAPGDAAPGECLPKMCGSVDMIANSDDTIANTTLDGTDTITCRDGFSGGGVVKCVLDDANPGEVVWKYQSANQPNQGTAFDTVGYPRCAPVQCPGGSQGGQGISKNGTKPVSGFTNVAPDGTCECADNYVPVSGDAGSPQPRMSYDDDCVGNACTTPVGNTDGADFSACNGQTSSSTATCTPTKTDFTCETQTGLWCLANGTYMANTTCTAAGNDPDGPTLETFSGSIPLTGTYNCSTDADTFTAYETAVEDTFTGVLADRTWTWAYVADNNRITYVTDQFAVAENAAVQTAFDTAFAVPSGPATLAGQPILAACNLTAGAPENTAGPGTDGTPAPSDPGTASSAVFCLFSMMLALFAHLA